MNAAEPNRIDYLLRECMATAVRLAITRHDLEIDPDAATEEEIAYDAAGACFGEECCEDQPIAELAEFLSYAKAEKERADRLQLERDRAVRDLKHAVACMDRSCKRCNSIHGSITEAVASQEGEHTK